MAAQSLRLGRVLWGSDDCVSFALPDLPRDSIPELRGTEPAAARAAARSYGSVQAAWRAALEACGYHREPLGALEDGDRLLGRDAAMGVTVAVVRSGVPWVRLPFGTTRAVWMGNFELWRREQCPR